VGLAETTHCRRTRLLGYFGETRQASKCSNCDNCLSPPKVRDGSVLAQKLLSCVYRTGERFGAGHLVDVLTGRETDRVKQFRHQQLSVFGVGADLSGKQWHAVLRQLVALGYLRPDSEAFGAFKLTESARGVLKGATAVMLREEAVNTADQRGASRLKRGSKFAATSRDASSQSTGLLKALRGWRSEMARSHGVPAYVVFNDVTLEGIATTRPRTHAQLRAIVGIGDKKLERYGDALIALVDSEVR
jgi:ATP-dependent DNA helicase RecQ